MCAAMKSFLPVSGPIWLRPETVVVHSVKEEQDKRQVRLKHVNATVCSIIHLLRRAYRCRIYTVKVSLTFLPFHGDVLVVERDRCS